MKAMKKLFALTLAVLAVLAMSVTAFAAGPSPYDNGTITINNATVGQTYTIYQILYLESYNAEARSYAYKATTGWSEFVNEQTDYLTVDDQGYVTWVEGADVVAFGEAAKAYATELTTNQGQTKATTTTVAFENLNLGYYLVDSTLGTIVSLDTTNNTVVMEEKNTAPTIDKVVKEDSTGEYGASNTAQIGDKVEFKTTVHAKYGALNYVVHDTMTEGLTFNGDVVIAGLTLGTDYSVTATTTDSCDFEIIFTETYLKSIKSNTDIVITYSATLNDKAVISTGVNTNTTYLSYSDTTGVKTTDASTETTTFKFDLVKTDAENKVLDGAKFELYDAATGGNKIALVKDEAGYRVATAAEKAVEGFTSAIIETVNGQAVVLGLDAGTTYYLEETVAPAGYNKLAARVPAAIVDANLDATVTNGAWTSGGVHIVNQTGTELPDTGGIGTTIFYTVGGILVLAAVVFLVTKRRVATEK